MSVTYHEVGVGLVECPRSRLRAIEEEKRDERDAFKREGRRIRIRPSCPRTQGRIKIEAGAVLGAALEQHFHGRDSQAMVEKEEDEAKLDKKGEEDEEIRKKMK